MAEHDNRSPGTDSLPLTEATLSHLVDLIAQRMREGRALNTHRQTQLLLYLQYQALARQGGPMPTLAEVGFNVYSPTDEDGILLYLLSVTGMATRRLVDIGAGTEYNSSSANLILNQRYEALLIEGDQANCAAWQRLADRHRETREFPPTVVEARVTAENINELLTEHGFAGEIDVLCIDVDGIDYWLWRALDVATPRIVLVEYQDILGPDRAWTVPYDPGFDVTAHSVNHELFNYSGASLRAFADLAASRGYRLVGTNRGGWNAFFVRNDLAPQLIPEVAVADCFAHSWNVSGMAERFPLVAEMPWVDVS